MRTIEEFQRGLIDPALVSDPPLGPGTVTRAHELEAPIRVQRNGGIVTQSLLVIRESPAELAAKAGVSQDVYSLARMMKSEGFKGPIEDKARTLIAKGQAARRAALARFPDEENPITRKLTASVFRVANGHYGEQSGRYAATSNDPRPWHIEAAKAIIADELPDVAPGTVSFLDAWQSGGTQRGKELPDFIDVMVKRHRKDKLAWFGLIPGIPASFIMFYPESSVAVREEMLDKFIRLYRTGQIVPENTTPPKPIASPAK